MSTEASPEPTTPPEAGDDEDGLPIRRKGAIPRALLDEHALTVVRRLQRFGHEAYLVGGCVRDLLVGLEPKDFDVVTDARPNRIRKVFRNARIIGRRFRLAHIRFGPTQVIETSTFRGEPSEGVSENVFGTAPEDARRRDFTINALFYDPLSDEVIDWAGGLADLEAGVVRSIGDPAVRLREDPVRMIRAVHFASRMGFRVEEGLEEAIVDAAPELAAASPARLYVELVKVLQRASARPTLHRLHALGVLRYWLPELVRELDLPVPWPAEGGGPPEKARQGEPEDVPVAHATWNLLAAADRWGMAAHDAEEALLLAPLLGPWLLAAWRHSKRRSSYPAFADTFEETLRPMAVRMSIPRRTQAHLRDLLWLLPALRQGPESRYAGRLVRRPGFLTAVDLLRLDLMARDCPLALVEAWEAAAPPRARQPREGRSDRRDPPRRRKRGARRGRRRPSSIPEEAAAWTPAPSEEDDE